jgi:hypothetical protein
LDWGLQNDEAYKDDQYHHIAVLGDSSYFVRNHQAFVFYANATSDARICVAGYYRNNRSPDRRFANLESGEGIRNGHSMVTPKALPRPSSSTGTRF